MATLGEGLQFHDNTYRFDPADVNDVQPDGSLSVVILYYNTGELFEESMHHLNNAARETDTPVEVVIVDDGSESEPPSRRGLNILENCAVVIKTHEVNKGRTAARNTGLEHATGDTVVYMDSDIVPDNQQLQHHAQLHTQASQLGRNAVVTTLFEWREDNGTPIPEVVTPADVQVNDWRVACHYEPTWIGCEADKAFVGNNYRILDETHNFRSWKKLSTEGQYGPWVLPNMVIGGMFSANRRDLQEVNGFDDRFTSYGFDETTGVTKLLVNKNNIVVPSLKGGAINLPNPGVELNRAQKDASFREMHQKYFGMFLQEEH